MKDRIPQRIDYHRYTEQGVSLDGLISLSELEKDLPRFSDAIVENIRDVNYFLEFDTDVLGNRFVTGHADAQVVLQCQRCMDNYQLDLNCEISIAFVQNDLEQVKAEDSNYDIFWLEKKELFDPRVLIEDELLLALPQIPMHPESEIGKDCDVRVKFLDKDAVMEENADNKLNNSEQNDKNNPFAILSQLKK